MGNLDKKHSSKILKSNNHVQSFLIYSTNIKPIVICRIKMNMGYLALLSESLALSICLFNSSTRLS